MKAEELMLGDWVKITHCHTPKPLVRVKQMDLYDFNDALFQIYPEITYEPIPLTSEILEKNGFKKKVWWKYRESDVTTYAIGDGFHIELSENEFWLVDNCIDGGDYGYESNWIKDVKYVHKLQHLLKDLEIEKEIIL